jgi:hypothetical protein
LMMVDGRTERACSAWARNKSKNPSMKASTAADVRN